MIKTLPGTQLFIDQQTKQAFNVDTILLSAFADIPYKTKTVIDIGTGIGSIMLYLSLKTKANLIGIEIQPSRVQEALKNIELNQLSNRISVMLSDVKDVKLKDVDCIICNPPFFKVDETSNVNVSDIDRIARHEISLNLEDLAYHASRMLKFGGKLILIHRPDRFAEIVDTLKQHKLEIKRVRFVHPYVDKKPNHVLIEAIKQGHQGMVCEPPLILYQDKGIYTKELEEIYGGKTYVIKPTHPKRKTKVS